jgi:hypothetical protein
MATGEKRFSVSGRKVKRIDNSPFAAGRYKLVVQKGWEVKTPGKDSKSGLLYVNGYFTVPSVNEKRRLYHMFFVDLSEGSDGASMVDRNGGVTEFLKAQGVDDAPLPVVTLVRSGGDREGEKADVLSPKALAAYLNSLDGVEVEAQVKVQKGSNGYADKNVVDFFIEAEESASDEEDSGGLDEDETEELDSDEDESTEEVDEDEADELDELDEDDDEADEDEEPEEEEEKPAPKKAAPKKAAAPPAKKKSKK